MYAPWLQTKRTDPWWCTISRNLKKNGRHNLGDNGIVKID